jgi:hypothetical protein
LGKFSDRVSRELTLYVRALGWLQAVPKPPAGSKRAEHEKNTVRLSRGEQMAKAGTSPPMPPNPMPHVVNRLIEIGLTEPAGMGMAPIGWRTIAAWSELTGVALSPWEARLLRKLSAAYLAEYHRAEEETCPPPWRAPVTKSEAETEEARLIAILG